MLKYLNSFKMLIKEKKVLFILAGTIILILLSSILLFKRSPANNNALHHSVQGNYYEIPELQQNTQPLYFTSKIEPIKTVDIISQVNGIVLSTYFNFGQRVEKDALLMQIRSDETQFSYREALGEYLKAKDKFNELKNWQSNEKVIEAQENLVTAKNELNTKNDTYIETENLYQQGLVAESNYLSDKHQYEDAQINVKQAEQKLQQVLKEGSEENVKITALDYEKAEAKYIKFKNKLNSLEVKAPIAGIVLFPISNESSKKGKNDNKEAGNNLIQENEVLLSIGDMYGIALRFQVDEASILKIRLGEKVKVTGVAFPGITLEGSITQIARQAFNEPGASSLPTFNIKAVVSKLTPEQQKIISVGMSAKLEIIPQDKNVKLLIPLTALVKKQDEYYVKVQDSSAQGFTETPVIPGETTIDSVEVRGNLRPGDKVLLN